MSWIRKSARRINLPVDLDPGWLKMSYQKGGWYWKLEMRKN